MGQLMKTTTALFFISIIILALSTTTSQQVFLNSSKMKRLETFTVTILQAEVYLVEQISGAIFQGGGLRSTTFVSIYQNVRIGL